MDIRYAFIYTYRKRDVAHLVYGKREMPVFGIIHGVVLLGTVVRLMRMCFKILSKTFFP